MNASLSAEFRRSRIQVVAAVVAIVFARFMERLAAGGLFEMRTLYALVLRFTVWCLITIVAYRVGHGRNGAY